MATVMSQVGGLRVFPALGEAAVVVACLASGLVYALASVLRMKVADAVFVEVFFLDQR